MSVFKCVCVCVSVLSLLHSQFLSFILSFACIAAVYTPKLTTNRQNDSAPIQTHAYRAPLSQNKKAPLKKTVTISVVILVFILCTISFSFSVQWDTTILIFFFFASLYDRPGNNSDEKQQQKLPLYTCHQLCSFSYITLQYSTA